MRLRNLAALTTFLMILQSTSGNEIRNNRLHQERKEGIYAELNTNKGKIILSLNYKKAPMTVANFIGLAEGSVKNASYPAGVPFYNGSIWHRVVKGHVIQGGSPAVDKSPEKEEAGATGYVIPNEISDLSHNRAGMLGMANSGPNTNTCQFYITLGDRSYLDGNYTLFGEVASGMEVVNNIVQGDTIISVKIIRAGDAANKFIVNNETFKNLVDSQWKKVKKEDELRKASDEKFISDNYPGLIKTTSGLRYKILVPGNGNKPSPGTTVNATYTGRLIGGVIFASSPDGGKPTFGDNPAAFNCGLESSDIVKGLKEGIADMKTGEKRLLIIPAMLGYGETGFYARNVPGQKRFVISPGETLILEVTLISFK
jgi:cyclophilin family peptidyl-prolyl cis-trans isomerase